MRLSSPCILVAALLALMSLAMSSVAAFGYCKMLSRTAFGRRTASSGSKSSLWAQETDDNADEKPKLSPDDVLNQAIAMMSGGGASELETPDMVQGRIQNLVDQHPVLLFMKGNKAFPQCGFSDTATKILDLYVKSDKGSLSKFSDYHAVDVLADPLVREGIKQFSQWPTIPQLYIDGEFIGGSDIMMEMYEKGELEQLLLEVFDKQLEE